MIFLLHPEMRVATQALDAWGRQWLLTVPAPIFLTEIASPDEDQGQAE
jgi:hypothetical protein